MKIQTKQFGEVEFTEENILRFEDGLYGFEELKKFLLLKHDDDIFYWLTSVEQPEIVFPLFGIRMIDDKYPQTEEGEAFGIVKLDRDPLKSTINLRAPVYINQESKTGYQTILNDESYPVEYQLFTE